MGSAVNGRSPEVAVIGGTGKMGTWFADLLEGMGSRVSRMGRKNFSTAGGVVGRSDVVVISVPIQSTIKVIREIGPMVSEKGLLMDLTSIKTAPMKSMLGHSKAEVVGAHPLFGPADTNKADQRVALCPGRGEWGLNWLIEIFARAGIETVIMDAREHDHIMGLIQGVNHFSTLALALTVSESGFGFEDFLHCTTPAFRARLDRITAIMEQPSGLFESLLMDNPSAGESIKQYCRATENMARMIHERKRESLRQVLGEIRDYFCGLN